MIPQDTILNLIHELYATLQYKPPPRKWTILAAFYLLSESSGAKIISLATGTKCLAAEKLPVEEALHDSHAEVLARRGAVRWLLEEIARIKQGSCESLWIDRNDSEEISFKLRGGVRLGFYVSTVPCGDASMGLLAATQDEEMAALKSTPSSLPSSISSTNTSTSISRGRNNYTLLGVLRTKPARADAPSTASMSCSDKIAAWTFLGVQGALGARFFNRRPVYVDEVLVGVDLPSAVGVKEREELKRMVGVDCERALVGRLKGVEACGPYTHHPPTIHLIDTPAFIHSRSMVPDVGGSCNDSLFWVADSPLAASGPEVLINGYKRGVPPAHRLREKSLPIACRKSMLKLYKDTLRLYELPVDDTISHQDTKLAIQTYQDAKSHLTGPEGVFSGWIRGSSISFTRNGESTTGI
uniref:tRNA-specific adenosine deaminase 1-like n=1 Tax=Mycena chlorophos TaxID=658473 RepID=A0ABQ0LRX8_MYCCL|nr:tRNA-specific adenosine deaminase 1-like [Mycena chlorophos]